MRKKKAGMKMLAWMMAVVMFLTMQGMSELSKAVTVKAAEREMSENPVHHFIGFIEDDDEDLETVTEMDSVKKLYTTYGGDQCEIAVIDQSDNLWMGYNISSDDEEGLEELIKIMPNVSEIVFGWDHYAIICKDHSLWMLGNNDYGQIGNGTTELQYQPVKIMDDVEKVQLFVNCSAAIKSDGSLWVWGENRDNMFGSDIDEETILSPLNLMDSVKKVSFDESNSFILQTDGTLWGWGSNWYNFLSYDMEEDIRVDSPMKIMTGVVDFAGVADYCPGRFSQPGTMAVIKNDGSLWTWGGRNLRGVKPEERMDEPMKILEHVKKMIIGTSNAGVITDAGELYVWGRSIGRSLIGNNEVKDDEKNNNDYIVVPKLLLKDVKDFFMAPDDAGNGIDSGYLAGCLAIKTDGTLLTWGESFHAGSYFLGREDGNDMIPTAIMEHVMQAGYIGDNSSGSDWEGAAIKEDGSLWIWRQGKPKLWGPDDSSPIEDFQTEKTITINGGGSAYARFYLCDKEKKPLKNTTFDYYFVKDGSRYEYVDKQTDENGAFIFPTLPLSEGESHDFEYVISLKDSSKELYTDTYTIHANASHLAYTEEWSLSFGGGGSVEAGVSGEANRTYDRIIKLKHKADGTKDLELSLKAATDVGINAAEKLLEQKNDIGDIGKTTLKIADESISEKSKNNTQWTLLIQNYNENSEKHQELVDHFMTILFALDNSNNKMLKKALDEINVDLNTILKAKSQGSSVEVGVGASLVVVDIKIGSLYYKQTSKLFSVNGSIAYTYNTTKDFQEDRTGYEMGISAERNLNLFSNSLLDAFGYSGFNTPGFEGIYNLKTSSISVNEEEIKLKSEDLDQKYDGLAGDKVSKIYTFTVKDEEADLLKNKNENFKKLGEGRSGLLDVGQIRNMADDVLQCNKITYTESDKTKVKVSGKFGAKIAEVFSIGLNYSATRTTTVETTGGEKDKDGLYCTWKNGNSYEGVSGSYAVTDLDTILKPSSLKWLEKIKNSIVSVVGNTAEAVVRNVKAKINQTKTKYLVTITMLKDLSENLFSVESTGSIDENSDQKTEFVGNAYSVYVTDAEENEIESFGEEPIMLELSYDEEDLQNAGLSLEEAELLHIGKYDAESNAYDDMGGILDEENQIVKLSITKPGQYVLMVDQKAPEISSVTLSDATSRPTIGAYISDLGGISGIELWIDGNLLIDAENYMEFYNPLTETLVYEVENALTVGNHTIRLKAVDSFGNESEYFEKSFPVAGTPQIVEVNIPKNYQNRIDMSVLVDGYAIHCVEANVVETASNGTEESKVYALNDNGNNKWNLTLENVNAKKCAIEIVVYDNAGNMVKSSIYESNYKSGSQEPSTGSSSVNNPNQNYKYDYKPDKVKLKKVKSNKKGELSVKWKSVGASGYQIQYALNKTFTKGKRTKNVDLLKSKITLKKLKSKKKYFVRVRAYNKKYYLFSDGYYKVYGPWSNVKKCKVK